MLEKRFFDFSTIFLNFSGKKKSLSFFPRRGPKKESGTKVLASQLFLDCRARRSGWVGSTTLISSAFTALLNCAEVGRRNRILTNYRFLSHSLVFNQPFLPLAIGHVLIHKWYPHRSGWSGHGSPWWRSCFWIWLLFGSIGRFLALDLGLG